MIRLAQYSSDLFAIFGTDPHGTKHAIYHDCAGTINRLEVDGRHMTPPNCKAGVYAIEHDLGAASGACELIVH